MVKKINAEEFVNVAKKDDVALVDFSATWCGPCKMLAPVLEDISEKLGDKVKFYNVDVDDAPELAAEYRVNSVPCVVLMKKGVKQQYDVPQRLYDEPANQFVADFLGNPPITTSPAWSRAAYSPPRTAPLPPS